MCSQGVRWRANDAKRMHCPGCRARIKDTSLFTKDNACFYGAGCSQSAAAAYSPVTPAEQQLPAPLQMPPRPNRLSAFVAGISATDSIVSLLNNFPDLANNLPDLADFNFF